MDSAFPDVPKKFAKYEESESDTEPERSEEESSVSEKETVSPSRLNAIIETPSPPIYEFVKDLKEIPDNFWAWFYDGMPDNCPEDTWNQQAPFPKGPDRDAFLYYYLLVCQRRRLTPRYSPWVLDMMSRHDFSK
eukprot:TRINITY_DN11650_c0_g1_i2.p1 TRINITY_DN11650_c0_g1~~TRINITY_DN11650_c0_g1_i2.p1  ORF type:complete len:134 (-),score=30.81 TRINITY_DN11650_c0_g1_i2:35-436(-)